MKQIQKEAEQKKRGSSLCHLPLIRLFLLKLFYFFQFKEKAEDARARAAIKAQIEADKRERAEKAAREKALREGRADPAASASASTSAPAAAPATAAVAGRDFKETRLQIRLPSGGQPLTTTLPSDSRMSCTFLPI